MRSLCRCVRGALLLAILVVASAAGVGAQVPGDNVNMVSGTEWPGGDPFLQRQNEPSIAVSSVNDLHLVAGANDYRTVDLPQPEGLPGGMAGDASLGLYKSLDGGQTWKSTLLPGYPQDLTPEGLASPLKAYRATADPTVRAGTDGLFYYSGIAFNRDSDEAAVFVHVLFDTNSKENGDPAAPGGNTDPIRSVRTVVVDTGTAGQFVDKTWLAVDVPRFGAGTCHIDLPARPGFPEVSRTIAPCNAYLAWSRFTGS